MLDKYNRRISYLRISVTDRCNLRCRYCMPEEGIKRLSHAEIITFEEIMEVIRLVVPMGIDKIRITGGEPLIRKGIVNLIEMISEVNGIRDLSLTTNGILLADLAQPLKMAGLKRINISLDTTDPEKYSNITCGGHVDQVLHGIEAAKKAGLHPVKINCVVENSHLDKDAELVEEYCRKNDLEVRFIRKMSLEHGVFSVVQGGTGGHCQTCNRLRLTANAKLKPCLFNDLEYDIRATGIERAVMLAVENKPEFGTVNTGNMFYNIGG